MMIFKEKLRTPTSNQKRSYFGMEYEIIHPQTTAFIFVSFCIDLYCTHIVSDDA